MYKNFTLIFILAFQIHTLIDNVQAAENAANNHTDCTADKECVSITDLKQSCRHEDPTAKEPCPIVNRKYAAEIESVDCFANVGCRPVARIKCHQGRCIGESP